MMKLKYHQQVLIQTSKLINMHSFYKTHILTVIPFLLHLSNNGINTLTTHTHKVTLSFTFDMLT